MESGIFVCGRKPDHHIFIKLHGASKFFDPICKIYFVFIPSNSDKITVVAVNIEDHISRVFGIPIDVVV